MGRTLRQYDTGRIALVEHGFAEPGVSGSIPDTSFVSLSYIRHGVVGNISACHAEARGSIPRVGVFIIFLGLQRTGLNRKKCNLSAVTKGRMAEWSKAPVLGTGLFGGASSNLASFIFLIPS